MSIHNETGCGDHSCVLAKPKGVGTNGGCTCSQRILKMGVRKRDQRIKELETKVKYLCEALDSTDARYKSGDWLLLAESKNLLNEIEKFRERDQPLGDNQ